jgi:hypothetical protein
LHPPLVAVIV